MVQTLVLTAYLSLAVQFITGLINIWGLTIPIDPRVSIFKDLLWIELIVQVIEFIFYIWLIRNLQRNVTPYRYLDWFITTPTMLVTLMAYLDSSNPPTIIQFIKSNLGEVIIVVLLNTLMLVFGLLGELECMNVYAATLLGFIPFVAYFYFIYQRYISEKTSPTSKNVFWYFFGIWSLYGVAAFLPYDQKNSMYNILDLFAKNFFGLFLIYLMIQRNREISSSSI